MLFIKEVKKMNKEEGNFWTGLLVGKMLGDLL
jgi:hypothetical protein